jgi:uncharacterized protein (DUF3820 family)
MDAAVMPWGKHKGERIDALPDGYVKWLLENCDNLNDKLYQQLRETAIRNGVDVDV